MTLYRRVSRGKSDEVLDNKKQVVILVMKNKMFEEERTKNCKCLIGRKKWGGGESCAFVYKRENKNCMFRCAIGTDCYRSSLRFTHNFAALNSCNKKGRNSQWSVVGRENITLKVRKW